jgi:hypothetical protein
MSIGKHFLNHGKSRQVLALIAGVLFAGAAAAQGASPFASLFGGSPREGRSAYAPAPVYAPAPFYGYGSGTSGYSSAPGYADPFEYKSRPERRPSLRRAHSRPVRQGLERPQRRVHPRAAEHKDAEQSQSPNEVMAAIKALKPGKGPLGPFLNDPTLHAGDIVVTTQGLMVYRGAGGSSHKESEFVSVANAFRLTKRNKKTLISLETASRLTPQRPLGAEVKSSHPRPAELASSTTAKAQSGGK